jgi:hypothetical protein
MAELNTANRLPLLIGGIFCAAGAVACFGFRPIPPVGLVAGIDLTFLAAALLVPALFPGFVAKVRTRIDRIYARLEEKWPPDHLGRWVP